MDKPKDLPRHRASVDIPEELYQRIWAQPEMWGNFGRIVCLMLEDLVDLMEEFGAGKVIGAFLDKAITMREIAKIDLEEKDNGH